MIEHKWIVYKLPVGDGVMIMTIREDCFIPTDEATVLYTADSYQEANDYSNDVRDVVVRTIHIDPSEGDE